MRPSVTIVVVVSGYVRSWNVENPADTNMVSKIQSVVQIPSPTYKHLVIHSTHYSCTTKISLFGAKKFFKVTIAPHKCELFSILKLVNKIKQLLNLKTIYHNKLNLTLVLQQKQ